MELGDLSSVRSAAKEFLLRSENLNILVCNAGEYQLFLDLPDFAFDDGP
jgi:hypothetical protein